MEITTVRTEGLGDATYVLVHEGLAVVVDPQRDLDRFERVLDDTGADLRLGFLSYPWGFAIAWWSRASSRTSSSTPSSIATSRRGRPEAAASLTISLALS